MHVWPFWCHCTSQQGPMWRLMLKVDQFQQTSASLRGCALTNKLHVFTCLLSYRAWLLRDMAFSYPAQRRSSLSKSCKTWSQYKCYKHSGVSEAAALVWALKNRKCLGARPAQQSECKLADGRNHQVHSHSSPWFVSSMHLFLGQFEDGQTPLKAVDVGRRTSRAVLRLQVRVSCSFLVQQETLQR